MQTAFVGDAKMVVMAKRSPSNKTKDVLGVDRARETVVDIAIAIEPNQNRYEVKLSLVFVRNVS